MRRTDDPGSSIQLLSILQLFCSLHCITAAFFLSGKTWLLYICFHINPCHLSDCKYIPFLMFPPTCLLNVCGVCTGRHYFRFLLPDAYRSWWNMCMHNLLLFILVVLLYKSDSLRILLIQVTWAELNIPISQFILFSSILGDPWPSWPGWPGLGWVQCVPGRNGAFVFFLLISPSCCLARH